MTEGDANLIEQLRGGDVNAFDHVYATYNVRLFSFLVRLSRRRDTAEDLAQETWLKFAKAAPSLRTDTRLAPFLFTIARNAYISHRRWALLDISRLVTYGQSALSASLAVETPDLTHERATEITRLDQALGRLPVASREVLLLVGAEDLGHDHVAAMLGISPTALRQRLCRARNQLTTELARHDSARAQRGTR